MNLELVIIKNKCKYQDRRYLTDSKDMEKGKSERGCECEMDKQKLQKHFSKIIYL